MMMTMTGAMDAAALKRLYERELVADLDRPACASDERAGAARILVASCHLPPGDLREADHHAAVWVWSDLHLGHAETISAFARPFETVDEMDDTLFGRWRRVVGPADVIVCLGDVAVQGVSRRCVRRLREAPGRKILVVGNHDPSHRGVVDIDAFDEVYGTVYAAGAPDVLMTHKPLRVVPAGCVNLHGHLHGVRVPGATPHINISVEQVCYRPQRLTAIRGLAARLVTGEMVSGSTTAGQLERVVVNGRR